MKIENIDVKLCRMKLPKGDWGDQINFVTHIEIILVDVTTDTGLTGTGFSHTSGVGGATIVSMLSEVTPILIGQEVSPRALWDKAWKYLRFNGTGGITTLALAGLDIAYWDIMGKAANMSLVDMLGRYRDQTPLYGSGINLHLSIEEVIDQVQGWKADGFAAGKVKVGKPDLEEDVYRLAKLREAVGSFPLMVDANQGWTLPQAVQAFKRFEQFNLTWIEEPLPVDDIIGHKRLRELAPGPIGLGENLYTVQQFNHYFSSNTCDFVQADIGRVGGITPYMDIAAMARAWNLPMAPHFIMELSATVLCSVPNIYLSEYTDGGTLTDLGVLQPGTGELRSGHYTPSTTPGHGLVFNREKLAANEVAVSALAGGL